MLSRLASALVAGLSLFEATAVTTAGMTCAYGIALDAIAPFVT